MTTVPHRGPTVAKVAYEDAEQLYAVRAQLEGFAGEQFATRGSAAEMARLTAAVEEFELVAQSQGQKALLAAKTKFYAILMDGCGMPSFVRCSACYKIG